LGENKIDFLENCFFIWDILKSVVDFFIFDPLNYQIDPICFHQSHSMMKIEIFLFFKKKKKKRRKNKNKIIK